VHHFHEVATADLKLVERLHGSKAGGAALVGRTRLGSGAGSVVVHGPNVSQADGSTGVASGLHPR
jgi:hypothetical protein